MSQLERRLQGEWTILQQLCAANPTRLAGLVADDLVFSFQLKATPALALGTQTELVHDHQMQIRFPLLFPAVPMEAFLQQPVLHPNIHPESGFVCLWNTHQVGYTMETAVHRAAAMLGLRLWNREALHVMQPSALKLVEERGDELADRLAAPLLQGLRAGVGLPNDPVPAVGYRRRLS